MLGIGLDGENQTRADYFSTQGCRRSRGILDSCHLILFYCHLCLVYSFHLKFCRRPSLSLPGKALGLLYITSSRTASLWVVGPGARRQDLIPPSLRIVFRVWALGPLSGSAVRAPHTTCNGIAGPSAISSAPLLSLNSTLWVGARITFLRRAPGSLPRRVLPGALRSSLCIL